MAASSSTDDRPVSLSQPAPTGPIPTTAWHAYFSYGIGQMEYDGLLEQRNPCIRSLRENWSRKNKWFLKPPAAVGAPQLSSSYEITKNATFPYPAAFRRMMNPEPSTEAQSQNEECEPGSTDDAPRRQEGQTRAREVEIIPIPLVRLKHTLTVRSQPQQHDEETGGRGLTGNTPPEQDAQRIEWKTSVSTPIFGVSRTSIIEFESRIQPTYVVLGLFPQGSQNPKERVVFIDNPEKLFWKLYWATFRLRGCDTDTGAHKHIQLDNNGIGDLQLLMNTYKRWYVPRHISLAWSDWIHRTLNNSSLDVLQGQYAIELVLDWSVMRISTVVLLPVLLSLGIGLWLNSSHWTDLATIQTAWGTASYIVTAGALLAAMLGFLDIADK
ncbi:hypothetical protein F53441_14040 [Fusarium austroafricanum]|uniref:Transmembrane protein n=1 Tax=Fusarium austroafricanum TaxID=2364996 RepID=A0A8H4NN56_9HYPO|nr:hypothetical protein F53441_14040 [Fusarium austroafricanum]